MPQIDAIMPVFPVSNIEDAIEHYTALGFTVEKYDGDEAYAYVKRDNARFHLWEAPDINPEENFSSAYLLVDDADALAQEWTRVVEHLEYESPVSLPVDTDYGRREGAHVDPDGNLLRFGHRI
ncbi:bleomycin resistance protein [Haematomicrobium sanguinis]|uniref:bleomycin resistance protein n=1 Tax=Haematomicrobium sanguinis TaxID=479106 RepID=UPI000479AFD9|nr:VOC family protein [Haematomicrobium sanguinis]